MWKFTRNEFFFELLSGLESKTVNLFAWFFGMVCSNNRYSSWIYQEKPRIWNLVKNNLIYGCIFFLLARGAVGVLFSTSWRNIYWFLMVGTGSKCLVDIWKRVHKKSEASDVFSSWCFFGLNEVALFLMFAVCFIKFLMYWDFFALNWTKSTYTFVNRHSVISWSPKEGN